MNLKIKLIVAFIFAIFASPNSFTQDQSGNNLEVADSAHLQQNFMSDAVARSSESGNSSLIVLIVIIAAAIAILFLLKSRVTKRKSK